VKVILYGATGMVGQGVLRECLVDPEVEQVLALGRRACGVENPKLLEIVRPELFDYSDIEHELAGYDACFFCLGVSAAGMNEEQYTKITYELTLAAAETLVKLNPNMTFIYVSGAGTDGTEQGRTMWARVKGKTENDLLKLPFKAAYMFRPALIQPMHGIKSRTTAYRVGYAIAAPLFPVLKALFPRYVTTTEDVGRAMLRVAKQGHPSSILENDDLR
jgi:uncharacterized protein YbjT (DUF2867 family)